MKTATETIIIVDAGASGSIDGNRIRSKATKFNIKMDHIFQMQN
jgi:hypothetical protein